METMKIKRSVVRAAAYAAVGLSMYAMTHGSALAWSDWTPPGQTSNCHYDQYSGTANGHFYVRVACDGSSSVNNNNNILFAINKYDGVGRNKTQAVGWSNETPQYTYVTARVDPNSPTADNSASAVAPGNIITHRCDCSPSWVWF